jgi:hypothetical protein
MEDQARRARDLADRAGTTARMSTGTAGRTPGRTTPAAGVTTPGGTTPSGTTAAPGPRTTTATTGAGTAGANLGETATQAAEQAKEKAGQVLDQAREQLASGVSDQKMRAADSLGSVAQAVRQTGTSLRSQDQANIAGYADTAAEQIERFAGYLRDRDLGEIVGQVESFARRQPVLFLGGAFALGFLGARSLKSSAPSGGDFSRSGGYGAGGWGQPYGRGSNAGIYGSSYAGRDARPCPSCGTYNAMGTTFCGSCGASLTS